MTATVEEAAPVSGEIVLRSAPAAVEEYHPRIVMSAEDAKALDDQLRECMKAILREGTDYGTIPGAGDRKNLLKPGAEKLLQWFGFGSRSIEVKIERDDPDHPSGIADKVRRVGVTYRTEVTKTLADGREVLVATCEGYAGYDEDRYYKTAEEAQAKAKASEEKWARIDHRAPNPNKWQYITDDYRAPWNTVVKMAQKRSYVGAAIDATSAAGLFTQDMEDVGPVAEVVPQAAPVSEAGTAAVMGLPVEARKALDRWCREQGWPGRNDWDTAQWCAALVQAGRIAMEREFASHGVEIVKPGEDAWVTPEGGADWVQEASAQAAALTSKDAGRVLYAQAVAKFEAGEITKEQKNEVCNLITAQIEFLDSQQAPVEGTVSAPDGDPWQAKVEEITSRDDADAAIAELDQAHADGHVDSRRHKALRAAMAAKGAAKRGAAA